MKGATLFRLFKYSVYLLLCANVLLFFLQESAASVHAGATGFSLPVIIETYVMTIDTTAWVALLLVFELETYVLEDDAIQGGTKWLLNTVRFVCSLLILYSFYGYCAKTYSLYQTETTEHSSICAPELDGFSLVTGPEEYESLNSGSCLRLTRGAEAGKLILLGDKKTIVSTEAKLAYVQKQAWVDVINSATWIIVVILLQIDVLMQLSRSVPTTTEHRASTRRGAVAVLSTVAKAVCYSILLAAAIYWGVTGELLDFWDAFLWIIAFLFIELNIFQWRADALESNYAYRDP